MVRGAHFFFLNVVHQVCTHPDRVNLYRSSCALCSFAVSRLCGATNFEVAPRYFGKFCIPVINIT